MRLDPGGEDFHRGVAVLVFSVILILPLLTTRAMAHKVNVFGWVEGDRVFVEGYFRGGKKAKDSLVEVFNEAGVKLLEGRTDETGRFSFKIPEKTDVRIVLTASMGHKNDFIVSASDFRESPSKSSRTPWVSAESRTVSAPTLEDPSRLETMIEQTMDRKLAPVIQLIRDSKKEGPTVAEIIGGIGYIFGLVGVAMYFNSRKKRSGGQRAAGSGQQDMGN
ncbi:MAG: hypothetical protein JSU72_09480 [Deltaproteobacteria bacterium]|nr:MAG: hypothetical protein JSU72_09480 [Deltaproteobacteria bacterium]